MCQWSFKSILGDICREDRVAETGICPRCMFTCVYCEKKEFVDSNTDKLCSECNDICNQNALEEFEDDLNNGSVDDQEIHDDYVDDSDDGLVGINGILNEILDEILDGIFTCADTPNYILVPDDSETINLTADEKKTSHKIANAYNKSCGNLGSDGNGGSTNGEITIGTCKAISTALQLNSTDCICDLGSGGGKTLTLLVAMSQAKIGIGIECETMRHNLAMNFNKWLLQNVKEIDIPVMFINEDINNMNNLNGMTKIYMYDAVFPPKLLYKIAEIFNTTSTIQLIVSAQSDLKDYGFNGELIKGLGCFKASGGAMSHSFYLYKSNYNHDESITEWNPILHDVLQSAQNRNTRLAVVADYMLAFHSSSKALRTVTAANILGETRDKRMPCERLYDLWLESGTNNNSEIVIDEKIYKLMSDKPRAYKGYNEQALASGSTQYDALLHIKNKQVLIAPSFDGIIDGNGKILVALLYDPAASKGAYFGIVYHIELKKLIRSPVMELFAKYDHLESLPFDVTDILKVNIIYNKSSLIYCFYLIYLSNIIEISKGLSIETFCKCCFSPTSIFSIPSASFAKTDMYSRYY